MGKENEALTSNYLRVGPRHGLDMPFAVYPSDTEVKPPEIQPKRPAEVDIFPWGFFSGVTHFIIGESKSLPQGSAAEKPSE